MSLSSSVAPYLKTTVCQIWLGGKSNKFFICKSKMFLPRLSRWRISLDSEMPNLSDTLQTLVARFISISRRIVLESMLLDLSELAWLSKFQQPEQNFLDHQLTILSPLPSAHCNATITNSSLHRHHSHNKCYVFFIVFFFFCFCVIMAQFKLVKDKFLN